MNDLVRIQIRGSVFVSRPGSFLVSANVREPSQPLLSNIAVRAPRFGRAFTLIEMVVVIAIIGILAGLLLAPVAKGYSKAKKLNREIGEGQTNILEMEKPGGLLSAE